MNYWIVQVSSGWITETYFGEFMAHHTFMCSCRGNNKEPYKIISNRTPDSILLEYKIATGERFEEPEVEHNPTNYF